MYVGVGTQNSTMPVIETETGASTAKFGGTIDDAVRFIARIRDVYGKKMAQQIVGDAAAAARKIWFSEYVNAAPAYSWKGNPGGKLQYGSEKGPAWSRGIHTDGAGVLRSGSNRRMASFSLYANNNHQATSTLRSYPMNFWEEDVTYKKGHWGPWGTDRVRVRPGIHWIEKAAPAVEKIIPSAVESAARKVKAIIEEDER